MRQALHILWKDMRHHWPEIVLVALTTGFWAWLEEHSWTQAPPRDQWLRPTVSGLMGLMWLVATARVVQGESLVGDRQFWQTRPYRWYSLFGAKVVFVTAFILGPLAVAEWWMLSMSGLPFEWAWIPQWIANLGQVLGFGLIPMMLLAAVTENLVQLVLSILGLGLLIAGAAWLGAMPWQDGPTGGGELPNLLAPVMMVIGSLGLVIWQYARRRTGMIRLLLCGLFVVLVGVSYLGVWPLLIRRAYTPARAGDWALNLVMNSAGGPGSEVLRFHIPQSNEGGKAALTVAEYPITISGVPIDHFGFVEGSRVTLDGPGGFHWESAWMLPNRESTTPMLFSGSTEVRLMVIADRALLSKMPREALKMEVELATAEYEDGPASRVIANRTFSAPGKSKCQGPRGEEGVPDIQCRTAFATPGPMLWRYDPTEARCPGLEEESGYHQAIGYGFLQDSSGPFDPVLTYEPYFREWNPGDQESYRHLCAGTPLTVNLPKMLVRVRRKFDVGFVHLEATTEAEMLKEMLPKPPAAPKPNRRRRHSRPKPMPAR